MSANTHEQKDTFLGSIDTVTDSSKPWITDILVNGESLQFKVNTGADVTIIPVESYSEIRDGRNFTYYASIMLNAFNAHYAQNYAGIIGASLVFMLRPNLKLDRFKTGRLF